jgi:hypothetical protein
MIEITVQEAKRKRQDAKLEARLQEQLLNENGSEQDGEDGAERKGSQHHGEDGIKEDGSETDTSEQDQSEDDRPEQQAQNDTPARDQDDHRVPTATTHSAMSAQEKEWWAMNFEELYKHAVSKNFGKTGKESRKSGRVKIIK